MARLSTRSWFTLLAPLMAAAVVLLFAAAFPRGSAALDRLTYDLLFRHCRVAPVVDPRLTFVPIDDKTIKMLGEYPLRRATHARLLRALSATGVARTAWDMLFDLSGPQDAEFAAAMEQLPTFLAVGTVPVEAARQNGASPADDHQNLISRFRVGPELLAKPWPVPQHSLTLAPQPLFVRAAGGGGHVMASVDSDGVLRRIPLVVRFEDRLLPSLALRVALDVLGIPPTDISLERGNRLVLGRNTLAKPISIPLDREGNFLLNISSDWRKHVDVRSYGPLLTSAEEFPEDMREGLAGRTLMVGAVFTGSGDYVATPADPSLPGVLVTFNAINTILTGRFITPAPAWLIVALALLLPLGLGTVFLLNRPVLFCAATLVAVSGLLAATALLFAKAAYFLPVAVPLGAVSVAAAALAAGAHVSEHRRASRLAKVLARFVSPALLREIHEHGGEALTADVRRVELTILFADVAGFTTFTEKAVPEDVSDFLAKFYGMAMDALFQHQGTLDKFLGDGILAYWGAPDPVTDKECQAVRASLELQAQITRLGDELEKRNLPRLQLRCGITTAYVTAGYLGDERHAAYTIVGRAVNLASRLQNHAAPGEIVTDKRTATALEAAFRLEKVGALDIKGFDQPVEAWRVRGEGAT